MKDIPFHPIADEYPLMSAHELGRLEEGMRQWGYDDRFPVVLYQKKILDGRNRFLAAKAAGVKPKYLTFKGTDDEARTFAQKANEERRHLAADWLKQRRDERIERVAKARQEGKSQREIADQEGVSHTQVQSDIKAATGKGLPVNPPSGKVTGKDGREQPAKKPPAADKPPSSKLCERCQRIGVPSCDECRKKTANTNGTPPKPEPPKPPTDKVGHAVPTACSEAFANLALFEELDTLARQLQKGIDTLSREPGGEHLRRHLRAVGNDEKTLHKSEHLDALKRDLRFSRPHSVCPYCEGKATRGCKGCDGLGWVGEVTWKDAANDVKARLA